MTCHQCSHPLLDEARFCGACGAPVASEDAGAVEEYRVLLSEFLAAGPLEDWQTQELGALRAELGVRGATHERLLLELTGSSPALGVELAVDSATMRDYRVGQQCLLRLRVRNTGERALRALRLSVGSSATVDVEQVSSRMLGPGRDEELSLMLRPRMAGHHALKGVVEVVPLRGESTTLGFEGVAFRVAADNAMQQVFNIDARSQRVGIWENLGAQDQGGLVDAASWHEVPLRPVDAGETETLLKAPEAAAARMGDLYTGKVVETQALGLMVEVLPGCIGWLARSEIDASIANALGAGDTLLVRAVGLDREGRVVLSQKQATTEVAPPALTETRQALVVVDPSGRGDARTLQEAIQRAGERARIVLRAGTYQGPVELRGHIELVGEPDVVIESAQGCVIRAVGESLKLQTLVLRGTAPKLRYAPDGVEVRSGRVVLQDCEIATTDGNLTPGRAVAVRGPGCKVVVERCTLRDNGVGIAVDTSWAGFFGDEAAGAHVRVNDCRLVNNKTAASVAGAGRELSMTRCTIRNNELGVNALSGAQATIEACAFEGNTQDSRSDADASLVQRGNH